MEKYLLNTATNAEKFFEVLLGDHTRTICDIIEVAACEFADACLEI